MTLRFVPNRRFGLLVAAVFLVTLPPAARAATSVSQHGITWTFDKDYPTGRFANGDYWVVGPVTITSITPRSTTSAGVTMHGSMINPAPNAAHGYDSRIKSNTYDATKNVALKLPRTLQPGTSLVSAVSYLAIATGDNPQIKTFAILTVLGSPAPAGSFRPPPVGTEKTLRWNKSQLDYSKLRSLPRPASTPSLSSVEALFARPWLEQRTNWTGRYLHAGGNQPTYGRDMAHALAKGLLSLQLNYTKAEKERLLVRLVQYGIDVYGSARAGAVWGADGGHNMGRKMPLLLAGAVLGDSSLLAYANAGQKNIFQEDRQTWYVLPTDVGRILYTADGRPREKYILSDVGIPEWGEKHFQDPTRDGRNWNAYYRTVAGAPTVGHVLTAHLMGLKSAWNWPALFDYTDRFYRLEAKNAAAWPNQIQPFVADMWAAYRNASTSFTVDNTSTDQIWQEVPIATQTGTFTCAFDVVASTSTIDGIAGLAQGVPSQLSHLVASVRFTASGTIVANNGSTYQAVNTVHYSAGVKYRVVISADVAKKTYSVNVTPQGGSAVTVAQNWAFRSTTVTKVDHIGFVSNSGAVSVTNVGIQGASTSTTTSAATSGSTTVTSGDALVRVNPGGGAFVDSSGKRWSGDTGFLSGLVSATSNTISGTTTAAVYQSCRYALIGGTNLKYGFNLTNGNYVLRLHFAETTSFASGKRVFNVVAEGRTAISKLDIYSRVGANRALIVSVPVTVSDGRLGMELVPLVGNPKICGIEIYQAAQ